MLQEQDSLAEKTKHQELPFENFSTRSTQNVYAAGCWLSGPSLVQVLHPLLFYGLSSDCKMSAKISSRFQKTKLVVFPDIYVGLCVAIKFLLLLQGCRAIFVDKDKNPKVNLTQVFQLDGLSVS